MTERDVLEEAREKVRYLDEARAYGITPLEGELRGLLAGLADELDESRAEVERMTGDVTHWHGLWRDTVATAERWAVERDEAVAAVERVHDWYGTVRYALTPHQQGEFDRALDGGESNE